MLRFLFKSYLFCCVVCHVPPCKIQTQKNCTHWNWRLFENMNNKSHTNCVSWKRFHQLSRIFFYHFAWQFSPSFILSHQFRFFMAKLCWSRLISNFDAFLFALKNQVTTKSIQFYWQTSRFGMTFCAVLFLHTDFPKTLSSIFCSSNHILIWAVLEYLLLRVRWVESLSLSRILSIAINHRVFFR